MNERTWNQRMLGLTFNAVDGRITIFRSTLEELSAAESPSDLLIKRDSGAV